MNRYWKSLLATALFATILSFALAQQRVTFVFAHSNLSTYYMAVVAQEMGYFAEEGLDVTLQPTRGGGHSVQQIISGAAEVGLPTQGAVINAVSQGFPLVGVYTFRYGGIFALVVPTESDVQSIADLEGKVVGVSDLGGGEAPLVRGMLAVTGLIPGENVEILPIGEGSPATLNALRTGQVAAYASSAPDMVALAELGFDFRRIPFEGQTGFETDIIVVTPETLQNNRDMVVGIGRALAKGSVFAATSFEATEALLRQAVAEEFTQDSGYAQAILREMVRLAAPPEDFVTADGEVEYGRTVIEQWDTYQDLLASASETATDMTEQAIAQRVDVDTFLTNDLIEEMNDFDHEAIKQQALNYGQ